MIAALALAATAPAPAPPVAPGPIGQATMITADDYPVEALRQHQQGVVGFALDVDALGNVTDCRVTRSSGYDSLDRGTCRLLMARARYAPRPDEHNLARPFTVTSAMTWRLPGVNEGRERQVSFRTSPTETRCVADFDGRERILTPGTCGEIVAAVKARGDALDAPVTVWLPDKAPTAK